MQGSHSDQGTIVFPDEAALVVDADGEMRIFTPEYGDEDHVPYSVMVLTAFWIKLRDDEDWTQELVQDVFGDQVSSD